MPTSRMLKPGNRVMVYNAGTKRLRAIVPTQHGITPAEIASACPTRVAGKGWTEITFTDGVVKAYPTNAEWILA